MIEHRWNYEIDIVVVGSGAAAYSATINLLSILVYNPATITKINL